MRGLRVGLSPRFDANGMSGLRILSENAGLVLRREWRENAEGGRALAALEEPTLAAVDRLAHDYSFKCEHDDTWAVQPLPRWSFPAREDPSGELRGQLLGPSMGVGRFLCIAGGVAAAFGKVRQPGLIHNDIYPAAILAKGTAGEKIRLTGLGVASRLPRERQAPDPPELVAGTLACMAPERTRANTPTEWP